MVTEVGGHEDSLYWDSDDECYNVPRFERLRGKGNAYKWIENMESYLMSRGLWSYVDPDDPADEEAELTSPMTEEQAPGEKKPINVSFKHLHTRHIIYKMCEAHVQFSIRDICTGRAAFREILRIYRPQEPFDRYITYAAFIRLRMEPENSIKGWARRIIAAAAEYKWQGGQKIEEIQLITMFLEGLTPEYKHLGYKVWENQLVFAPKAEEPTLWKCLRSMETLISWREIDRQRKGEAPSQTDSKTHFPPKNPAHKHLVCQKCAKVGHTAHDCRSQVMGFATSAQIRAAEKRVKKMMERE